MRFTIRKPHGAGVLAAVLLLLPSAASAALDAKRGKTLYESRCGACHSLDDNGPGPRHRGVFGCRAGTQAGFGYSDALKKSGIVWDVAALDRWLADPNALVPGNTMAVKLANVPKDRADLIAYLETATSNKRTCEPAAAALAHGKSGH